MGRGSFFDQVAVRLNLTSPYSGIYKDGCVFIRRKARLPTTSWPFFAIIGQGVPDIIIALKVSGLPWHNLEMAATFIPTADSMAESLLLSQFRSF